MHTKFLLESLEGRDHSLKSPRLRWEDNIKMDHMEIGFGVWIRFIWLRVGVW
jgi:hypothetical protein